MKKFKPHENITIHVTRYHFIIIAYPKIWAMCIFVGKMSYIVLLMYVQSEHVGGLKLFLRAVGPYDLII